MTLIYPVPLNEVDDRIPILQSSDGQLSEFNLRMSRQPAALTLDIHDALGDVETPKASTDQLVNGEDSYLSTSTPSTVSTATTALPSPEIPGPATNFGTVIEGAIYRSSFPKIANFEHMASLGLKTILTLVETPYPVENQQFIADNKIMHVLLPLPAHKSAFDSIPNESMQRALSILVDPRNYPVLIHCNKGKHRTGCVVGCLRKISGWSMQEILDEYRSYAGAKARSLDEKYMALLDKSSMIDELEGGLPAPGLLTDDRYRGDVNIGLARSMPGRAETW